MTLVLMLTDAAFFLGFAAFTSLRDLVLLFQLRKDNTSSTAADCLVGFGVGSSFTSH